jgi:transposase
MADDGTYLGNQRFPTAESELVPRIVAIDARHKRLALEEGTLARWAARTLEPYVEEVFVCDPRQNALISRSPHKSDAADAYALCRLLRLGELKRVYQAREDHRALFKAAVQHYLDLRDQQVALKQKIKAQFRRWGVLRVEGSSLYSAEGRQAYLDRLSHEGIARQLRSLYSVLDATVAAQKEAKAQMLRLGKRYAEIARFEQVPGIGPIGSHLFDAFIQTPHRFKTKQKLWRYCGLGIRSQRSNGKPLGYEELDPCGRSELKAVSYRAWLAALRQGDNAVAAFFAASLRRTGDRTHARLNTQRKILATLLSLWRHESTYRPERFLGSA